MQTLTVRHPVNMRSGYDTGAGILKRQVPKGTKFEVEQLVFPAVGEIWAKLRGTFTNDLGIPSAAAYVCVVQGANVFCDLAGQPDPTPGSLTYAQGYADCKADVIRAIQALP